MERRIDTPTPGFYRTRLVRKGPWVAALVYRPCAIEFNPETFQAIDRYPPLLCLVDDKPAELARSWPFLHQITEAEYLYLVNAAAWDRAYQPSAPAANPTVPIDLNKLPAVF
jgi:hypothetical protein